MVRIAQTNANSRKHHGELFTALWYGWQVKQSRIVSVVITEVNAKSYGNLTRRVAAIVRVIIVLHPKMPNRSKIIYSKEGDVAVRPITAHVSLRP